MGETRCAYVTGEKCAKVKVKVSLEQAMKAQRGKEV
jgi:hypothetical protein